MANAVWHMNGLSLHYYTVPNTWANKGSALDFSEKEYYMTLKKTLFMEELINNHSRIMDVYDPGKRVGLIVDEWGTWYDSEKDSKSGVLFQQNTMRDALVAAVNLNIFNRRCDRVKMANIAQLVNVLQAVILTEGEKMLLTPTYHVFDLYKEHQGGTLIDSYVETTCIGPEDALVPNLHVSASQNSSGKTHITLANLSAEKGYPIEMELSGASADEVSAKILTGEIHAHNDFTACNRLKTENFTGITRNGKNINFIIPACSVLAIKAG